MSTAIKPTRRPAKRSNGAATQATRPAPDAAASPSPAAASPFTPIEDYAFLSNCHTGALLAPVNRLVVRSAV